MAALGLPPELVHEALPGGGELDPELLDDAVRELNRVYTSSGLAVTRALGECVVHLFAAGDLEAFRVGAHRHVTYAALARREDLHVEPDVLSRSVAILHQLRDLPKHIGESLSPTHHRYLLAVSDPAKRLQLATQAVTNKLSTRQLEQEVARLRDTDTPRRGPKPQSPARKLTGTVNRFHDAVKAADLTDADPDDAEALVEALRALAVTTRALHAAARKRYVLPDAD